MRFQPQGPTVDVFPSNLHTNITNSHRSNTYTEPWAFCVGKLRVSHRPSDNLSMRSDRRLGRQKMQTVIVNWCVIETEQSRSQILLMVSAAILKGVMTCYWKVLFTHSLSYSLSLSLFLSLPLTHPLSLPHSLSHCMLPCYLEPVEY